MAHASLATGLGVIPAEVSPDGSQIDGFDTQGAEQKPGSNIAAWPQADNGNDYFKEHKGLRFAGTHLILDLWEAEGLDDLARTETALVTAAEAAGATVLHTHLHHFTENGGISGVVVLAESHISIHTWPERSYAAIDLFMCGDCDPYDSVPVLTEAFGPKTVTVGEHKRGLTR